VRSNDGVRTPAAASAAPNFENTVTAADGS
jgi:hypothetical protein